ncbi:LuxR C-terminal-related transcriptional regulator [Rhizobium sp. RU20A]|uniref:helix-turn-helix transcriptional regulator n=1 Tax=Rhizobium sp. RU20A TaxID=1907412 RepID=UPI00122D09F0|nr:LuxR C-terminal-related transcriptional regulator [Rhizobium sp. RU20A]
MISNFAAWNGALAEAMAAVGTPEFPDRLEDLLRIVLDFDILMVFGYRGVGRPIVHFHNIRDLRAGTVIDAYVAGPYLLDPFYAAATSPGVEGVRRLRDMAPDQFYSSEYFRQHYALTGIRDEVGIICRPAQDHGVVLSFTRPFSAPAFGQRDLRSVHGAAPVVRPLLENHLNRAATAMRLDQPPADAINLTLTRMTDGLLTPREIEITSLILRGHSTMSIAEQLGIVEGTVKIHRKNIYHKLGISSQAELFGTFIRQLSL